MGEEISPEIAAGNKLIAVFLGYKYYHAGIDIDKSECGGIYTRMEIFSKVPIVSQDFPEQDQYYFAELPNPDYKSDKPVTTWNTDLETISWSGLNMGQYITYLDYHRDWNSLMKAVEAIEALDGEGENYHIFISKRFTRVVYDWEAYSAYGGALEDLDKMFSASKDYRHIVFDESKLFSTWQAVVDFIEWRNKKKNG